MVDLGTLRHNYFILYNNEIAKVTTIGFWGSVDNRRKTFITTLKGKTIEITDPNFDTTSLNYIYLNSNIVYNIARDNEFIRQNINDLTHISYYKPCLFLSIPENYILNFSIIETKEQDYGIYAFSCDDPKVITISKYKEKMKDLGRIIDLTHLQNRALSCGCTLTINPNHLVINND